MTSPVYFTDRRSRSHQESLPGKLENLVENAGLEEVISPGDLVAVKLHFGEKGNTTFISPVYVRRVVDKIKEKGGKPYLVDTNTLYVGSRSNAVDHLQTAIENGFSYATVGAPLFIGDGLRGRNYQEVEVNGKHFEKVNIGNGIFEADSMVVLSHVKGHILTGFGGALKNLGMGGGNRSAKQMMHSSVKPKVREEHCKGCAVCQPWCPEEAITLIEREGNKKVAVINQEKCVGCAECLMACRHNSIKINWKSEVDAVLERMSEHAFGAVKNKMNSCLYINFLLDVIPDCDCNSWSDAPVVPDIGLMGSRDPVALDSASVEKINRQPGIKGTALTDSFNSGEDKFKALYPDSSYEITLNHAEELGMGTREYRLQEI